MASASRTGCHDGPPPDAIHPPTGATAMARPRKNCVAQVTRLANEYQKTMPSATGASSRHSAADLRTHAEEGQARHDEEDRRFTNRHRAARNLALRRPRVERVIARIDEPIERHGRAACRHHRRDDPAHPTPRHRHESACQQCADERERQGEHRVAEAHEGEIRAEAVGEHRSRDRESGIGSATGCTAMPA